LSIRINLYGFPPIKSLYSNLYDKNQINKINIEYKYIQAQSCCLELLTEEDNLQLVVHGDNTSTGNTSQDVSTATLEQGSNTLSGNNLLETVESTVVLNSLTRGHHHSSSDSVQWVRSSGSTSGNSPTQQERSQERTLQWTNQNDWLQGVVQTEVQTSVDNNTNNRWTETSVQTSNTVGSQGLLVDIEQTVELSVSSTLGGLGVVSQSGSGVVQRVDESQRGGTSQTTGSQVTGEPLPVGLVLLETEHLLELVLESKVQSLGWEVSDDVGGVTSPERRDTLLSGGSSETLSNTIVLSSQTTLLDHFVLVLDQQLDSLNWGGGGLRDSGGNTTHHEVDEERVLSRHIYGIDELTTGKKKKGREFWAGKFRLYNFRGGKINEKMSHIGGHNVHTKCLDSGT